MNRSTNEVRYFDAKGVFFRAAGRRGKGPGEFTNITAFATLPNDSLLVQDWSTSRVAVFTESGELARTFILGPPPQRPRAALIGAFSDQTFLGAGSDYLTDVEPPPGVFTLTQTLFLFSATGELIRKLNSLLERQFLFVADARGNARYIQPFGLLGTVRIAGDHYLTGDGHTFEIQEFTNAGRLIRIIRADIPRRRITSADKAAEKERILTFYGQKNSPPAFERFWATVAWPEHMPAFKRFEVGVGGSLWVELYTGVDQAPRWLVLDAQRRALGYVSVPRRFDLHQIRADGAIGVRRDADGVEQVVYYALTQR